MFALLAYPISRVRANNEFYGEKGSFYNDTILSLVNQSLFGKNYFGIDFPEVLVGIARKIKIPVIITNQVYSCFVKGEDYKNGFEKETNIVGGDLLQYWSKCIIELKKDGARRKAFILKHRSLDNKELSFGISDSGVAKAGFF